MFDMIVRAVLSFLAFCGVIMVLMVGIIAYETFKMVEFESRRRRESDELWSHKVRSWL